MQLFKKFGEPLTLHVGKKKERIIVHRNLLYHFGLFSAYCYEDMGICNDDSIPIRMPDANPQDIQTIVYWMYHGAICLPEASVMTKDMCESFNGASGLLARMWVIGRTYKIPDIGNDIVDSILVLYIQSGIVPVEIIPFIYATTWGSSPIRKLLIRIIAEAVDTDLLDKYKSRLPPEFLFEALRESFVDKKIAWCDKNDIRKDFCKNFHLHGPTDNEFQHCAELKGPMVVSLSTRFGKLDGPILNLPIVQRLP